VCLICHHTLVAPSVEQLELLQHEHICWERGPHTNRWGVPTYSM
jgi:hypothetical protein